MSETWCRNCLQPVTLVRSTPPSAWLTGCLGVFAALVVMLAVLFVALSAFMTAVGIDPTAAENDAAAYSLGYAVTREIGVVAPVIVALVVGGLIVRANRRWICPICRTERTLTR